MNQIIDSHPSVELSEGGLILTFTGLTKDQINTVDRHFHRYEALEQSTSPIKFFELSEEVRQACLSHGVIGDFWQYSENPQYEQKPGGFDLTLRLRPADDGSLL